jgi:hypothetical protein
MSDSSARRTMRDIDMISHLAGIVMPRLEIRDANLDVTAISFDVPERVECSECGKLKREKDWRETWVKIPGGWELLERVESEV